MSAQKILCQVGCPLPFGVSQSVFGDNFALFSQSARAVTLCLFWRQSLQMEVPLDPQANKTGEIWHIALSNLPDEFEYSYRITGSSPNTEAGDGDIHQLLDPYAKSIAGLDNWGKDRAAVPLRGRVATLTYNWEGDRPLNHPLSECVIYELHVRGYTQQEYRTTEAAGSFQRLIKKIPYLKQLGITTVELMPIHEFDEMNCPFVNPDTGEKLLNYWGYSSINFFAIKSAYSTRKGVEAINEFRDMVKAFHAAGIEVILDVVFNHTAEGGEDGQEINFKGLGKEVYYILDSSAGYKNYSGCGNTMNCNHPVVKKMILDALHYWVIEMHVDGFRFDLASVMGRDEQGKVLPQPPILEAIAKDPVLAQTKIIAEAWDAAGLYQVGSFPASKRWAEWNGKYRDTIRRFCAGEPGLTGEVATRIAGSEDLYKHSERNPYHSINFITSHDGFTMFDLVSYREKQNHRNGENNQDGSNWNYSQNFDVEGPSENPAVFRRRMQQVMNMATILMVSQGTPMILAGDELGRTQNGNNNAWCQDNEISWIDWALKEKHKGLLEFWRRLIHLRKIHPMLRRNNFFTGAVNPSSGIPDISWHGTQAGQPLFGSQVRSLAFLIDGMEGCQIVDDTIYVILNFEQYQQNFSLPQVHVRKPWIQILDTARPDAFIHQYEKTLTEAEHWITVEGNSIAILTKGN